MMAWNECSRSRGARNNPSAIQRKTVWWQLGRYTPGLFDAIAELDGILACPVVSNKLSFAFLPPNMVFSKNLFVFALSGIRAFAVLQSRGHESWARAFSSTFKDDLDYSGADCLETFPFPRLWDSSETLESAGREYYNFRAALMVRNNEGLTKTYNRFHDPDERDPDILELRELHDAMDRAVLDAYGWTDIRPTCEFLLDYEDEENDTPGRASRRRKPWRYRWPDEVRDEVLGRLLTLNAERAREEEMAAEQLAGVLKRQTRSRRRADTPLLGEDRD